MSVARVNPKRIRDQQDANMSPGSGTNGYAIVYNPANDKFELGTFDAAGAAYAAVSAHVGLSNPHSQYLLASGVSAYGATLIDDADAQAARSTLGLGTAAVLNVGTGINNIVQLDGSAKLPAVDGSQLTNLPGGGAVAGSTTQVIFNDAGAYGGDAGLTYAKATDRLTVTGGIVAPSMRPESDSTAALKIKTAVDADFVTFDTTNKRIDLNGGAFLNGIGSTNGTSTHYRDVLMSELSTATGTLKIVMPKGWSSTMLRITMRGYTYASSAGAWTVELSGYNFAGSSAWINTTAQISGPAPFESVRLAYDGTNVLILLGTTSTVWTLTRLVVANVVATHSSRDGWGTGWSASIIASESGISGVVKPSLATYGAFPVSIPTSIPANSDTTRNSLIVSAAPMNNIHARIGVVDLSAGGGAFPTYIQGGNFLGVDYNLLLQPRGGNVGIGSTATPNSKLDVAGTVQADGLRLDVTPTNETITPTHTITISLNGTNYKIPCVAA